jgi:peroxiredoxin
MSLLVAVSAIAGEIAVGAQAPAFALTNSVDGKKVTFTPGDGKLKIVVFTCNQCPYARAFEGRLVALGGEYAKKGVVFYAVDPNDENQYAIESMGEMRSRAKEHAYPYPYLKDADSKVAAAYGARVTPHVFVIDGKGVVRYRGYVDDSARPEMVAHKGLSDALDSLIANHDVKVTATNAFGCSIKWKS